MTSIAEILSKIVAIAESFHVAYIMKNKQFAFEHESYRNHTLIARKKVIYKS